MGVLAAQARVGYIATAFFVGAWGVGVPCAYLFAFHVESTKGLFGLWLGLSCGYSVVTCITYYGVWISDWETLMKDAMIRSSERRTSAYERLLDDES